MIASLKTKTPLCWALSLGFLTFFAADSALAQRGRGGGFGFDRSSPFRMLNDDDVQAELKLTDEQKDRIKKLEEEAQAAAGQQPPPQFPQNEEDRAAFFAEMRKQQEERSNAAMGKIKEVLQENQYQRLEQLRLHNVGLRALGTEPIAAELKLSDKQKQDLTTLLEEYQAIRYNFRAPREEREKQTEEMTAKIMAVLSNEQKSAWEAKLGPPPQDEDNRSAPAANTAGTATPAPMTPRPTYTPPDTEGPVVVSLDGTKDGKAAGENEKTPAAEKSSGPPSKEKSIRFHLENAPWEMVLREFARRADLTLQILDLPPGSLTYTNDDSWYTPTEALDILHGYLLQMGFVMIQRDRFLVIIDLDHGQIPPNLIPNIPISDLESQGKYGKHTLLNVVLPLEGAEANDAAREVEALKGPQGSVVPLSVSNSLVVTDTFANLKRIHNLLKGVTNTDPEAQQFKSFPLKHIVAEEAAIIVRDQLGLGAATSSSDSRSRFPYGFQFNSRDPRSSSSRSTPTTPAVTAKVTPDPRTNALLVTATKNDLAIAEQILTTIDIEAESGLDNRPYLHVYHLKKADVDEVQRTLDAIMPGLVVGEDEDRDGGRLHVKATPRQHQQVAEEIAKMDGTAGQTVDVIHLASHDPIAVSTMLNNMFSLDGDSAPMIMADSSQRRLMVRGNSDQIAQVRLFLSKLGEDGSGTAANGKNGGPIRMIPLGGRDAEEFARILEQVWMNNSDTPIRVVFPSNNPINRRSIPSMDESFPLDNPATQFLRPNTDPLDSKSTSLPRKPLYPVSVEEEKTEPAPARAETPAEAAENQTTAPESVTLRIGKTGEMTLDGEPTSTIQISKWASETQAGDRQLLLSIHPETPAVKFAPILGVLDRSGIRYTMKMSADEETAAPQTTQAPVAPKGNPPAQQAPPKNQPTVSTRDGKLPITVTVRGGELMLYDFGGRSEELDEMEGVIEQLALAIPPRTTWTVYYLRSADVTETAVMLEQLFPSSSISASSYDDGSMFGSLTSGLASLGGSLAGATGLDSLTQSSTTLRIIPELRSNSLFVSGPADQVRQVEQMLKVLDADDLPETLRDRVPRMIPVEHANVNEVATIVKDVYKDFLEDARQNQSRQNPLAAMMGGGGSSNGRSSRGNNGPSAVKMTIGVDAQTSKLVVSASDSLFQQVKEMVEELDKAAFEARRTVQIVNVNEASSVVLQQALTAMLPNVSVSTTSSSSSRGSSNGQASPSNGSSDDAERRARFESYMRSRSGGGDNSRSTGGDSGRSSSFRGFGGRGSDSGRSSFGGRGSDSGRSSFGGRGSDSGRSSFGGRSRGR